MNLDRQFAQFSSRIAKLAGRPLMFILAALFVVVWAVSGPVFGFTDTWQLIMNTVSSIFTFVMVFLIQDTQARDSEAMQAKLDELIRTKTEADRRYVALEKLPDKEIEEFRAKHGPRRKSRK